MALETCPDRAEEGCISGVDSEPEDVQAPVDLVLLVVRSKFIQNWMLILSHKFVDMLSQCCCLLNLPCL